MRYAIWSLAAAINLGPAVTLMACATAPKDIKAAYVAEPTYSCADRASLNASLEKLSHEQRTRRNVDIASFLLIGVTPSLVDSGDHRKQKIAAAKGELEALDRRCGHD